VNSSLLKGNIFYGSSYLRDSKTM